MPDIQDEPKHIESATWRAAIKQNIAAHHDADHWWLNGHYGNYRDWHNHPRNRHHNFSVISLTADGLIREAPDPETYQVYCAETLAEFNALVLHYGNAVFAEHLVKQYAAARYARNSGVWPRKRRTHIRKTVMIDGVRTKLERA